MDSRRKSSLTFLIGGILCFVVAAVLLHTFSGRFTDSSKDEEMPVMEDTINVASKTSQTAALSPSADNGEAECMVYITGAVRRPGVYNLKGSNRVYRALEAAGGFTDAADQISVNLAAKVSDGEHLHFPTKAEAKNSQTGNRPAAAGAVSGAEQKNQEASEKTKNNGVGLIDINNAGQSEFESLPGIGPKTAAAIITYRSSSGGFKRIEDLLQVKGIGPKKYDAIKGMVTIGR